MILWVVLLGIAVDSSLRGLGVMEFQHAAALIPLWLIMLWAFAGHDPASLPALERPPLVAGQCHRRCGWTAVVLRRRAVGRRTVSDGSVANADRVRGAMGVVVSLAPPDGPAPAPLSVRQHFHSRSQLPYTGAHEHHSPHRNHRPGGHLLNLRGLLLPARSDADHRHLRLIALSTPTIGVEARAAPG